MAFFGCSNIESVTCYATTVPTTSSDAFKYVNVANSTLYVPEASLQDYKSQTPWSEFGNIMSIEAASVSSISVNAADYKYYNTNGQRVNKNTRGLIIRNGKKYVLK